MSLSGDAAIDGDVCAEATGDQDCAGTSPAPRTNGFSPDCLLGRYSHDTIIEIASNATAPPRTFRIPCGAVAS
jgi:hypothetical protein